MASLTQAMSQGNSSLSQAMSKAGYSAATPLNGFATLANKSNVPAAPVAPAPAPGVPDTGIVPGSTLTSNLKALPGQLLSAGKALFNTVTGSEQGAGAEIAAGLPAKVTGEADLNNANQGNAASDVQFIKAMNTLKASGKPLTTSQQQIYDHILQTNSSVGTQTDLLPAAKDTNAQGLLNAGGVALDALTPAGLGKAKGAAEATVDALKSTPEEIAAQAAKTTAQQTAKVADVVAPKLSAAQTADALATRGGTKTGILGTIKANVDPAVSRIADTVTKYVPDFSMRISVMVSGDFTRW
jgi:hypothetical protein